ncbi:MAG TPA: ABC transporter permease subunit [Pararhodobacter sp.]|uniref:amino acid ABC transporter permease n=1 Tax=Pararhodobacter sp. TaxID=2127056 RepID=UPI001DE16048|nr:ABC transporter permease subunit [Pararhodobacter sp.]MCB1346705.1 ABC transporter permease subunit [Paracoccaceae bacterium]MCB1408605.1 ABC transporter permease subunit [Paracoccaceae bacterium]HPD94127.1 ABC transporter permease subunit [Pararhodobacter sp.]
MVTDSEAPKGSFRLSMLLYDSRYRSMTIQVFAFFVLMFGAAWLVYNTKTNLEALGKPFGFDFLFNTSGYDIAQRPIEYSSQSSHLRAAMVGLINTLILAVMACVTATVLGVFAGVLRLSNNWIIAKLMTLYIETFRNVPVLIWIIITSAVMSESMPPPSAFRGADPAASMILWDSVAVTNRGVYIPAPLVEHSLGSISILGVQPSLDAIAFLVVVALSIWLNRRLMAHATNVQNATGVRPTTWWKSLLILFVPAIVLLYALGFHLEYPELRGFNFSGGLQMRNSLIAMWIGLSVYTGAFIAEIVRAGILAISKGQSEAAFALGLQPGKTMRLVILPQALRVIVPPLISQYLNITKNTSLGLAVGYMDLRSTLGGITINQTGRELEGMLLMMLIYLLVSLIISTVMNFYNDRVKLRER